MSFVQTTSAVNLTLCSALRDCLPLEAGGRPLSVNSPYPLLCSQVSQTKWPILCSDQLNQHWIHAFTSFYRRMKSFRAAFRAILFFLIQGSSRWFSASCLRVNLEVMWSICWSLQCLLSFYQSSMFFQLEQRDSYLLMDLMVKVGSSSSFPSTFADWITQLNSDYSQFIFLKERL